MVLPAASEEQQIKARHQAVLQGAQPVLEYEISRLKTAVETRAYSLLAQGTLTPEVATTLWAEHHAYQTLLNRFNFRSK